MRAGGHFSLCVHVIDNSNNEIRGSGVERDKGGDEKQFIKFARPKSVVL